MLMDSYELSNEIIPAFNKGVPEALHTLVKEYYKPLCLFADRLIKDSAAAEDIVGETFVKLWNRKGDFETVSNIKAFLYITVRNASLNFLKQAKRESLSKKQLAYIAGGQEEFVLNEMIRSEVLREIMLEIERLPEQCGKVLKLGYIEGLKNQEIADLLHISVHTVKNQKARAIQLLKIKLRDRDLMAFFFLCSIFAATRNN
jgi:RNA polymerase sigma-70 factor (ECF subfamily)